MNSKALIYVLFLAFCGFVAAHKYKSGECPQVEPMQGFDMRKVSRVNKEVTLIQSSEP